jgi:hypothetical protein
VPGRQIPESAGRGARRMGRWGVTAELRPDELAGALAAMLPPGSTLDATREGELLEGDAAPEPIQADPSST